jgi:hypothetical protein
MTLSTWRHKLACWLSPLYTSHSETENLWKLSKGDIESLRDENSRLKSDSSTLSARLLQAEHTISSLRHEHLETREELLSTLKRAADAEKRACDAAMATADFFAWTVARRQVFGTGPLPEGAKPLSSSPSSSDAAQAARSTIFPRGRVHARVAQNQQMEEFIKQEAERMAKINPADLEPKNK